MHLLVVLLNMVSKFTEATGDFESQIMFHFCVICHIQLRKIYFLRFPERKSFITFCVYFDFKRKIHGRNALSDQFQYFYSNITKPE